jgi:uncharacterized membrane protein HdeD (DUF308 family)
MDSFIHVISIMVGTVVVISTIFSAISTFVLPRSARSRLNRLVFGVLRRLFELVMRFTKTYKQQDAIMAYYAPVALLSLLPVWYLLIAFGYSLIFWGIRAGDYFYDFRLSGSSLFTLGFIPPEGSSSRFWHSPKPCWG